MSSSTSSSPASPEATTPEVTGYHSSYYLNTLPPTWDTLQKGLAFFAVIVILRSCLGHLCVWASSLTSRLTGSSSPRAVSAFATNTPIEHHRRQNKEEQDRLAAFGPQQAAAAAQSPSRTTINHFRPYIHQRYPGSIPPWVKEPPKFHMDEGRGLVNPLETGGGGAAAPDAGFNAGGVDAPDVLQIPVTGDQRWKSVGTGPLRHLLVRPPPAPPLTPPELSHSIFTLGSRPHSHESFIHQPNPDYASASSSASAPSSDTSPQARRYSYAKTIPIGVPVPRNPLAANVGYDVQDPDLAFSPSSYPPTSPLLPPAPPTIPTALGADDSAGRSRRKEIDLQGQVVSVLDQDGAGWKRHTRVYGGGVCLACKAAGQEHGAGGFYGATVSPEEMR